jgi:hypothetical protein
MPMTASNPNGTYDTYSTENRDNEPTVYEAPTNSWEEAALRQASVVMTMPRRQVQSLVKPSLPQIGPRPPKHKPAPTVMEVIDESGRLYTDYRGYFSGSAAGYEGSSRNMGNSAPY